MRREQIIEALQALELLLEQEPYLSDLEREAIIRAVFNAILSPPPLRVVMGSFRL